MLKRGVTFSLICLSVVPSASCQLLDAHPPNQTLPVSAREAALIATANRCPVADRPPDPPPEAPPGPAVVGPIATLLVGAAAPIAADFAVRVIDNLFEQGGKDLSAVRIASGSASLRRADGTTPGCVVVLRGPRGSRSANLTASRAGNMRVGDLDALGLADYPYFYLEIGARSAGGNVLELEPRFFQFGQTAAVRRGDGSKSVGVTLIARATSGRRPTNVNSADEEAFTEGALGATSFSLGRWAEGTYFPPTTPGVPVPVATASAPFADQARVVRIGNEAAQLPTGNVSIYAFIYESADRSAIERIAVETLSEEGNQKLIRDFVRAFVEGGLRRSLPRGTGSGQAQQ